MAAKEMYDYVDTVAPDNDVTLEVSPSEIREKGWKNQIIHYGDDNNETVIDLSSGDSFFEIMLTWPKKNFSDSGILLDFFHDAAKGNGFAESFKLPHTTDGHTYVVKFRTDVERAINTPDFYEFISITFKVMGRIAD